MESNQRSRQKKASGRPAGSYAFFVLRTLQKLNRHSRHTPDPLFCQATVLFVLKSAEQLRAKSGKTMLAMSVERALANFAEEVAGENEVGQSIAARGFS